MINKTDLKQFIRDASRAMYASGGEPIKVLEADGSTTVRFEKGSYKSHDNYFGGEPYGGREVIFFEDKAIWMMIYYGVVHEGPSKEVYSFLTESLSASMLDMPYRGPAQYERGEWRYENTCQGEVERFSGIEKIYRGVVCVYEAIYAGGFVDK